MVTIMLLTGKETVIQRDNANICCGRQIVVPCALPKTVVIFSEIILKQTFKWYMLQNLF